MWAFACMITGSLQGQFRQHHFQRISLEQGLPQGHVYSFYEDTDGFLWVAHAHGFSKFDGVQFKNYSDTLIARGVTQRGVVFHQDDAGYLWVGTTNGLNRVDLRTDDMLVFQADRTTPQALYSAVVNDIWEDSSGNLWLGTEAGFEYLNTSTFEFRRARAEANWIKGHPEIFCLEAVKPGLLLAGTVYGFALLDTKAGTFGARLPFPEEPGNPYNHNIRSICADGRGGYWAATAGGVLHIDENLEQFSKVGEGLPRTHTTSILPDADGNVWIGYLNAGLVQWRPGAGVVNHFDFSPYNPHGLINPRVVSLLNDTQGNLWIGTYNGINRLNLRAEQFELYRNAHGLDNNDNYIHKVHEDDAGGIWTLTLQNSFYSAVLGQEPVNTEDLSWLPARARVQRIIPFLNDASGRLWIRAEREGLYIADPHTRQVEPVFVDSFFIAEHITNCIQDRRDEAIFWFSGAKGLLRYDARTGASKWYFPTDQVAELPTNSCGALFQDSENRIWVGLRLGALVFEPTSEIWTLLPHRRGDRGTLAAGMVRNIVQTKDETIWITTAQTLHAVNPVSFEVTNYGLKEGMPQSGISMHVLDEPSGKIWISILNYIACFDPSTRTFERFNFLHQISNEFNWLAGFRGKSGRMYFGSINGFWSFKPEQIDASVAAPRTRLTDILVLNKPLDHVNAAGYVSEFALAHHENTVVFEFTGLHYVGPGLVRYAYKLDGFDNDWVVVENDRKATYTNLNSGTYTFRVKSAVGDGTWGEEASVDMYIAPPYWATWWFRMLIALLALSLAFVYIRSRIEQARLRQQKEIAEQQAHYKSRFLANMSHEIRTPMNAIIGINKLLLDTPLDEKQEEYIRAVGQSSENLLWIINDVLDQAKIESGKYSFAARNFEMEVQVQQLHHLFKHKSKESGLSFTITKDEDVPEQLVGDPIRLQQILTNLIGNSIKFTKAGHVRLHIDLSKREAARVWLRFVVSDSGIGIPADRLERIFESFEQVEDEFSTGKEGTGLGLSITRQLVEQQGGKIEVKSSLGSGSTFTVVMPFGLHDKESAALQPKPEQVALKKGLRILLVEDTYFNQLLAIELLKKHLSDVHIDLAENGAIALERVRQSTYDLILMDVKMPVMDGYEATRRIRAMEGKLRQVPILALTANAIPEELEHCKKAGMDDAITKPIDSAELIAKIHTLTSSALWI